MPTIFTKGDIFETPGLHAYAHGCNCTGAMDAGVAVAFRKKWPRMYEEYRLRCEQKKFGLGDVFAWSEGDDTVYNLGIQEHWKQKAQLPALSRSLTKMADLASRANIERVGLPRIAAGLGGLDWPRVKKVLNEVGRETKVTLVVFEQFIRGAAPPDATD
jgi:O-acetyl-ADP-ribose deacetylase (regulator of RNase III)